MVGVRTDSTADEPAPAGGAAVTPATKNKGVSRGENRASTDTL